MHSSFVDPNGIRGVECEVVFAGERAAGMGCGRVALRRRSRARAVRLSRHRFAGGSWLGSGREFAPRRFAAKLDGFGAKREDGVAVGSVTRAIGGPAERAAGGDAVANFGAEEICLTDELGSVSGGGMVVDFAGGGDLFEGAVAEQGDAVGKGHGFFLVVGNEKEGDADFALEGLEFGLHLFAEIGVESGERFVEE